MSPKPQVTSIVQYKEHNGEIFPAIVYAINDDDSIALNVFGHSGAYPVRRATEGSENGNWFWPPKV